MLSNVFLCLLTLTFKCYFVQKFFLFEKYSDSNLAKYGKCVCLTHFCSTTHFFQITPNLLLLGYIGLDVLESAAIISIFLLGNIVIGSDLLERLDYDTLQVLVFKLKNCFIIIAHCAYIKCSYSSNFDFNNL